MLIVKLICLIWNLLAGNPPTSSETDWMRHVYIPPGAAIIIFICSSVGFVLIISYLVNQ
jgi:hypothetical protein